MDTRRTDQGMDTTVAELAAQWGVTSAYIYSLLRDRKLAGRRTPTGNWAIAVTEIESYDARTRSRSRKARPALSAEGVIPATSDAPLSLAAAEPPGETVLMEDSAVATRLLDRALAITRSVHRRGALTDEELELAQGWLDGRLGLSQIAKVLQTRASGSCYAFLARGARELYRKAQQKNDSTGDTSGPGQSDIDNCVANDSTFFGYPTR